MERNTAMNYYTPNLDEFCLGFEFQSLDILPEEWKNDTFCKFNTIEYIERWIEEGEIRVKILDADDFKELGWEPMHKEYLVFPWFSKTENDIGYQVEQFEDGRYRITSSRELEEKEDVLFDGKIRNKFELSKIFNQVKWD